MDRGISLAEGVLWVAAWFGVMLAYTAIDVAVWRKIAPAHAKLLNVVSIALCMGGFLYVLTSKTGFKIDIFGGFSLKGVFLAIACAAAMYLLLDKFLDPIFEGLLPGSEADYQESIARLGSRRRLALYGFASSRRLLKRF